jgi:hypothetical protein
MRVLGAIAALILTAWLLRPFFDPAVSGYTGQQHWYYDRSIDNLADFERAKAAGRIHEDPERRQLRQKVLYAGSRLENSPCDPAIKPILVTAITALLTHMHATDDQPREMVTIGGKEVDAAPFLNFDAAMVIRDAKIVGLLHSEDFPHEIGNQFPPTPQRIEHRYDSGRFACKGLPGYPSDRN